MKIKPKKRTLKIYKRDGQWRWRITAENGKKVAIGGESYKNRVDVIVELTNILGRADDLLVQIRQQTKLGPKK